MRLRATIPLLLLAACSRGADSDGDGKLSAAEVSVESAKLRLQPGQWETTTLITELSATGLAAEAAKTATGTRTKTTKCITAAEAARPDASLITGLKDANCAYRRFSMADAKIDAEMTCDPVDRPGRVALTLSGNHSTTAYALSMAMRTGGAGAGALSMKATVSGKRLGACTPGQETES